MSAAVPLVKAFSNGLQQSATRIPHLRFHILQRQAQKSQLPVKTRLNAVPQKRWQHTSINITSDFSTVSRNDASAEDEAEIPQISMSGQTNTQNAQVSSFINQEASGAVTTKEYFDQNNETAAVSPTNIYEILQEGHPDRILFALLDPSIGTSFVQSASNVMFADAICSLDYQHFVKPYKTIHRDLNPTLEVKPKYRYVRSVEERFESFVLNIETLITRRIEAGHKLDLQVHKFLLKCAGELGDLQFAQTVWDSMVTSDGIEPDLACYNSFLAAHVWSHAYSAPERRKMRVIEAHLKLRSSSRRMDAFSGHRVSPLGNPFSEEKGIRNLVLGIFGDLNKKGLVGDESTFINLMLGMAREKDMEGVESVLKSVWNINVELLAKYDEEELESPTFYKEDDPLRPSEQLLFAIVHIYCINNQVSAATTLMDYVARNYNLRIPKHVWTHLLDWAYVLSRPRDPKAKAAGYATGLIDPEVVGRIYSVMTDAPHNIQPTVPMIISLCRIEMRPDYRLRAMYDRIKEGMAVFEKDQAELSDLFESFRLYIPHIRKLSPWDGFLPAEFFDLRRRFILLSLQVDADLEIITRAVSYLFREMRRVGADGETEWPHRRLPNLIDEFQQYIPNTIQIKAPSGMVEIEDGKSHRMAAVNRSNQSLMARVGIFRAALDTDDYDKLLKGLWAVKCQSPKGDFKNFKQIMQE